MLFFSLLLGVGLLSSCQNIPANQGSDAGLKQGSVSGYRTEGSLAKDQEIEKTARKLIRTEPKLKGSSIEVVSFNQVVLVTGQVTDQEKKNILARLLAEIPSVRTFHDKSEVAPARTLLNISSDWLMTTKLKAGLLASDVDVNRIYLTVNNANAYLMGMVTRAEAKRMMEWLQETESLRKIVLAFEYLD